MTIYDAIKARLDAGEEKVPVTSLVYGMGYAKLRIKHEHFNYPLRVVFNGRSSETYTVNGRIFLSEKFPQLALGHYDTQLETAQAIKEQNYDTE